MSTRQVRIAVALVAPIVILLFGQWLDARVLTDLQRQGTSSFDTRPFLGALTVGFLVAAGGAITVAWLAGWSRSVLVAVAYLVVGASLLLATPLWLATVSVNGGPQLLPDPIEAFLSDVGTWSLVGPAHIVAVVCAALALSGVGGLVLAIRRRAAAGTTVTAVEPGA